MVGAGEVCTQVRDELSPQTAAPVKKSAKSLRDCGFKPRAIARFATKAGSLAALLLLVLCRRFCRQLQLSPPLRLLLDVLHFVPRVLLVPAVVVLVLVLVLVLLVLLLVLLLMLLVRAAGAAARLVPWWCWWW